MTSPLDFDLGSAAPKGKLPPANVGGNSPLDFDLSAPAQNAAPTAAQQATIIWNQTPGWQKPLLFVSQGINDVGTGLDHLLGIKTNGPIPKANYGRYAAPPGTNQQASPAVWNALDAQHPGFNYGVKWPTEFAMSAPGGEGAGNLVEMGASKVLPKLPEGASLLSRALYRIPGATARGAAYGVQQPGGSPGANAAIGAVTGPVFEGGASLAGKGLGMTADGAQSLWRKFFPKALTQPELDSVISRRIADQGLPTSVAVKPTPPGVELPTAVHSGDPKLMALQAAERISGTGTPFYEMAGANNAAIVNGLQQGMAPQADNSVVSATAHDLLQAAQKRAKAAVTAAYRPFDAVKGGVYLERAPVQNALREAYSQLLPAHQEGLPSKLREVMESDHPLHLTSDIEDLSARLNDAYRTAKPGTTAARAAAIMRDALNKGVDDAPLANQPELGALTYDPARNPLPGRNMALYRGERPGATPGHLNGGALWTTPSQELAAEYASPESRLLDLSAGADKGQPGRVLNYNVQLRKPYVLTPDNAQDFERFFAPGEAQDEGLHDPEDGLMGLSPTARQNLLNEGYDSVIVHHEANPMDTAVGRSAGPSVILLKSPDELAPPSASAQEASRAWKAAKGANTAFRERFPQGTARDTEPRQWLSRWLLGRKEPGRFMTEAFTTPGRTQAVLDAFENPGEREQMRRLMVNHYTNRLLSATREGIPGTRTLNAEALTRARAQNSALERVLLNPQERATLDRYVQAAHDNAKILQRLHTGSSETAALRNYGKGNEASITEELLKHGASTLHPAVGFLAHILPALAKNPGNEEALQRTLTQALLNPEVYNRVAGAPTQIESPLERLLKGLQGPAQIAATRPALFAIPRGFGPQIAGTK